MATMTDPAARGHAGRRTAGPAVAGLVYVAAWVAGLVIGPPSLVVLALGHQPHRRREDAPARDREVSGMALARQAGVLPPRADFPRVVLAAALTGGGVGYLLLSPALAWMALLSLPLLLIWVAGRGVAVPGPGGTSALPARNHPPPGARTWPRRLRGQGCGEHLVADGRRHGAAAHGPWCRPWPVRGSRGDGKEPDEHDTR